MNFDLFIISVVDLCFGFCSGNGQCLSASESHEMQCICNPGFTGDFCQCKFFAYIIAINNRGSAPAQN